MSILLAHPAAAAQGMEWRTCGGHSLGSAQRCYRSERRKIGSTPGLAAWRGRLPLTPRDLSTPLTAVPTTSAVAFIGVLGLRVQSCSNLPCMAHEWTWRLAKIGGLALSLRIAPSKPLRGPLPPSLRIPFRAILLSILRLRKVGTTYTDFAASSPPTHPPAHLLLSAGDRQKQALPQQEHPPPHPPLRKPSPPI